jgi:hypothetical protein
MDEHLGVTIVTQELRDICALEGLDAALRTAEEMIVAAASIIARERGPEAAIKILTQAAETLPDKRAPVH